MTTQAAPWRRVYAAELEQYGDTAQAVGWSEMGQHKRFLEILAAISHLEIRTALDAPCGLAHLCEFFRAHDKNICYTGWDLEQALIDVAWGKHRGNLETVDIMDIESWPAGEWDLVACSGLNLITPDVLGHLWQRARKVLVVNFLITYATYVDDQHMTKHNPLSWLLLAKELTPWVDLRMSYLRQDMTLILYRESRYDEQRREE